MTSCLGMEIKMTVSKPPGAKPPTKEYKKNFDSIFKKPKLKKPTACKKTIKRVE